MFGSFSKKRSPQVAIDGRHLRKLVAHQINRHGQRCDLNNIDVSQVHDFTGTFSNTDFDGDISKWNVSKATCMRDMFSLCPFNGDVSQWDVSNVLDMSQMFFKSAFNNDISRWQVANVTRMHSLFAHSSFNTDISNWDVANVTEMSAMFMYSVFNQSISDWNVGRVKDTSMMFYKSVYEGDVSKWSFDALVHASHIFDSPYFKSNLPLLNLDRLMTGSNLLSAAYGGRLSKDIEAYASVLRLFPNAISACNYLCHLYKSSGPHVVHIDYALHHLECPRWFDAGLFDWVKREQCVCKQMGLDTNGIFELVKNSFLSGGAHAGEQRADSIPFVFENIRSTV